MGGGGGVLVAWVGPPPPIVLRRLGLLLLLPLLILLDSLQEEPLSPGSSTAPSSVAPGVSQCSAAAVGSMGEELVAHTRITAEPPRPLREACATPASSSVVQKDPQRPAGKCTEAAWMHRAAARGSR